MRNNIILILAASLISLITSCQDSETDMSHSANETAMTFCVSHPDGTRATSTDFEEGDTIGVYVAESGPALELSGNLVNNEPLTLTAGRWLSRRTLYWDTGTYNAYAYYPHRKIVSIEDQPWSVETDQPTEKSGTELGGYEASDLLYAKSTGLVASEAPVNLRFRHLMSKITIRLVKGPDFEGELPGNAQVYIHNTVTDATLDLNEGQVTKSAKGDTKSIRAKQISGTIFNAIVVPQRIENRLPLIEVIMGNVSYLFESRFVFRSGINHQVSLVITDNPDRVNIEIGGEIENWN